MSQYPPPPSAGEQHYAPIYPAAASAQLLEVGQQQPQQSEPFNFSPPTTQSLYAKIEPSFTDQNQNQAAGHDGAHPGNGFHVGQDHHSMPMAPPPAGVASVGPDGTPQKANRLRKACDSCSIRKVKCDESGPPCRACAALDIPCTFERPSRRRGPPNRHAEAIKKRRLESPNNMSPTSPSSPTNAAHALAALSSHPPLSAESIAPFEVVEQLINDYFTYIHPLCPFPHEPSFRQSFGGREDYSNRPFLALLAAMISVLVASFPRKPRLVLKSLQRQSLFPNHMSLIHRCQQVCAAARGPALLERDDLTVYDAATSYLLGVSHAYTFRWRAARLYFAEGLAVMRGLGFHDARSEFYRGSGSTNGDGQRDVGPVGPDYITQEMGRRVFWTTFVSWRSMSQAGATHDELVIMPETPGKPYPPLPMEVDDLYIYPGHIEPQPPGVVPEIVGFNANVRVYQSYTTLATTELTYGINEVFDWERQCKALDQGLKSCKRVLDGLPPELTVWLDGPQENSAQANLFAPGQDFHGNRDLLMLHSINGDQSPEEKRKTQYEIQKANIYISQLATRSYVTERYFIMRDINNNMKAQNQEQSSPAVVAAGLDSMLQQEASPNYEALDQEMSAEKDKIVKDLLRVLQSISQVHMEPNADSFTHKVRQIVSTLLNAPQDRKSSVALQAEQYLHHFLEILVRLDRNGPTNQNPDGVGDEETELKHWADLREYQVKFTQAGGVLSLQ